MKVHSSNSNQRQACSTSFHNTKNKKDNQGYQTGHGLVFLGRGCQIDTLCESFARLLTWVIMANHVPTIMAVFSAGSRTRSDPLSHSVVQPLLCVSRLPMKQGALLESAQSSRVWLIFPMQQVLFPPWRFLHPGLSLIHI